MSDLVGTMLKGYRIDSVLGEGGMAVVYRAYHPPTDRNVALKVMLDSINQDATYVARFQQEARLIARLQHAHILPVYDLGEAGGRLFIAMRLIETGTLANQIRGVPMPFGQVRKLLPQIAGALDYAHSKGVIHRDLKPSNVLIDDSGNSLLTDFGIAKQLGQSGGLTRTGGILGTPAYMSPEQVLGQSIDGRSDVYALGVLLYQLVVGRVPFSSTTDMATAIMHVREAPPLPRTLNPAVPEQVERVILRALAKQPDDRWATAGQLATALEQAFLGEAPVRAEDVHTIVDPLPGFGTGYQVPPPTPSSGGAPADDDGRPAWVPFLLGGAGVLALVACVAAAVAGLAFSGVLGPATIDPVFSPTATGAAVVDVPDDTPTAEVTTGPAGVTDAPEATPSPEPTATATTVPQRTSRRIIYAYGLGTQREIYVYDLETGASTALTSNGFRDEAPCVMPDANTVVFASERNGVWSVYTMDMQGRNERVVAQLSGYAMRWPSCNNLGNQIAIEARRSDSKTAIYLVNADGSNLSQLTGWQALSRPVWAPDDSYLIYGEALADSHGDGRITSGDYLDIFRLEIATGRVTQLTATDDRDEFQFSVHPQTGALVVSVIAADTNGDGAINLTDNIDLYQFNADGSGGRLFYGSPYQMYAATWSASGDRVLASMFSDDYNSRLVLIDVASGTMTPLTDWGPYFHPEFIDE